MSSLTYDREVSLTFSVLLERHLRSLVYQHLGQGREKVLLLETVLLKLWNRKVVLSL